MGQNEGSESRTDTGGSAAAGGFNYQHRVTAWFGVRMLVGTETGVRGLYQGPVLEIACETGEPVDDCRVTVPDGILALQAKRSITLGKTEDSEMAKTAGQFVRQHLTAGHETDRLVLVTTMEASGPVRQHLRRALDRLRKRPEPPLLLSGPHAEKEKEALSTFLDHVRREWGQLSPTAAQPTEEQLRTFLERCWVWTLDVEHAMPEEGRALELLQSTVLSDPGQADSAWDSLLQMSAAAAADKTGFDRHSLQAELATRGIKLTGTHKAYDAPRFHEVSTWNAEQLNVHSAISSQALGSQEGFVLPKYVPRAHDMPVRRYLEDLAAGSDTRLILLRGGSCTGKTRTACEAIQAVLPNWRLAYPKTAEALLALLRGPSIQPGSVIWLDDLHHLLNEPAGGEAAALLRDLLLKPGPVALIATAWPDAIKELTATPSSGLADRHYQARALLKEAWTRDIPDTFADADRELERLAVEDASLTAAMRAAGAGAVTQTLAAAPELVDHWLHAPSPYGKAVITAAVDARRLGVRAPLPNAFLKAAASGYCTLGERAQAQPIWFDEALGYAQQRIKSVTSVLLPVARSTGMGALPGVSDLADYLEQHGAVLRWDRVPPADFWTASLEHIDGDDLGRLALNAFSCGRFQLSRDLNLSALRKGNADAFEGLCFSYIETGRILTQQGRDELASVVRDAEDGGYSLWYLGQTLWSIHGEPGGGGEETLSAAGELLFDSYEAGYLDAAFPLAQVCAAIGVDGAVFLADAHQKEAERAASSPPEDPARKWQHRLMAAPGADGSITPSAMLSTLSEHTVDDYVIQASVLRWWQECPQETRDLLDVCCRHRVSAAIGAARSLLKLPFPEAVRMAEDVLTRLADTDHSAALMELAHWRIHQWQDGEPAPEEPVPQDILTLLAKAAKDQTEARRLLGQAAKRTGDTGEAEQLFRGALDGGDYTVLPELAEVLYPDSPEDARQLALSGINADGSPCPTW